MKVSEAFLVNTKNFESIIETLVEYDTEGAVIDCNLLENLSYSDPNDLLVVRILKDFDIINNDGRPDTHYEEFKNPETTKLALAKGLVTAYEGIFDKHPKIHLRTPDKMKEVFDDHFSGKKTDLIIKYISRTFEKVVSYIGPSTIDAVLNDNSETGSKEAENVISAITEKSNIPKRTNGSNGGISNNQTKNGEEISDNNIDDFLSDFELKQSGRQSVNNSADNSADKSDDNETDDFSIQEYIKEVGEPAGDMKEKDSGEGNAREQKTDMTDEQGSSPSEEDIFNFEDEFVKPENGVEESMHDKKKQEPPENTDVDPIDLKMPMSQTTNKANDVAKDTNEHVFVQKAFIRKADLLHKLKRWEELVPTLDTIINRFSDHTHPDFKNAVERAVIRKAVALLKLGRTEEAMPALDSVIQKFKDSDNSEYYEQASRAMLYKANILERTNANGDQLLAVYNAIIERMDSTSEMLLKEKLDAIHCKRFDLLLEKNVEMSIILDASQKLINRFRNSGEHREYLQKAMIIRAETLDKMNNDEKALKAYDEFIELFS